MPLSAGVLNALCEMPRILREAGQKLPGDDLSRAPSDGGFSLLEQTCHLRDLEQEGYLIRIERILREERPRLEEFDGAKIASERNYLAQDFHAALDDFDRCRSAAAGILRGLSDDQLKRTAQFGTFGFITLKQVVDMMLEHDASHRRDIECLLEENSTRRGARSSG